MYFIGLAVLPVSITHSCSGLPQHCGQVLPDMSPEAERYTCSQTGLCSMYSQGVSAEKTIPQIISVALCYRYDPPLPTNQAVAQLESKQRNRCRTGEQGRDGTEWRALVIPMKGPLHAAYQCLV